MNTKSTQGVLTHGHISAVDRNRIYWATPQLKNGRAMRGCGQLRPLLLANEPVSIRGKYKPNALYHAALVLALAKRLSEIAISRAFKDRALPPIRLRSDWDTGGEWRHLPAKRLMPFKASDLPSRDEQPDLLLNLALNPIDRYEFIANFPPLACRGSGGQLLVLTNQIPTLLMAWSAPETDVPVYILPKPVGRQMGAVTCAWLYRKLFEPLVTQYEDKIIQAAPSANAAAAIVSRPYSEITEMREVSI